MVAVTRSLTASWLLALFLLPCAGARDTQYISGTSITGVQNKQLAVDRTPALYTGDFGDCLGGQSLFNVTRFDAAFYTDNSTVLLHLDGSSNIKNDSLMMHFSIDAYGENRFNMTFDPCSVNIYSLCPLNASVPITAWAVFQVGLAQIGSIPQIAFTIPDFEGFVRLRVFANSTESEIGCFQASMTNGVTLGHPEAISPVLAFFTLVAVLASFTTAAYGVSITHMRIHYAHSISVMVIFETFQSIFFSGALSVNFPSVLVAWWSNFAWSAGQIYSPSIVKSVDSLSGVSGNASQVGGAGSVIINNNGGRLAQQIYGRSLEGMSHQLTRREPFNESDPYDYTWAGNPVSPGLTLPGTWTGFSGTLAALKIPAANAFATGLIWLLVLLGLLIPTLVAFKFSLEGLVRRKRIKEDRMAYFRSHWVNYTILAILRTLYMAFFMIVTLAFYQFSFGGSAGAKALAAMFFLLFLLGIGGLVAYACRSRLRNGHYVVQSDRIVLKRGSIRKAMPYIIPIRLSTLKEAELPEKPIGSLPFARIYYRDDDAKRVTVHQDESYVKRFGWLSARYRRTRWWFFGCSLMYQVIRAAFIGGASATPRAQVYGLFVFDFLSFLLFVKLAPFEGRRNSALAVWMLGISKLVTTGLSVAFLPSLNVNRIVTTAIGVVIIVVQGLVVIGLMILVVLGAISSYMSLTRNREDPRPKALGSVRVRYYEHILARGLERKRVEKAEEHAVPQEPSFSVIAVRRVPKIEDEDDDMLASLGESFDGSTVSDPNQINSHRLRRTNSVSSRMSTHSLPRAARVHRTSWSTRDFAEWDAVSLQRAESGLVKRLSGMSSYYLPHSSSLNMLAPYVVEEEPLSPHDGRTKSGTDGSPTTPTTLTSFGQSRSATAVQTPDEVSRSVKDSTEKLSERGIDKSEPSSPER